jgi:hypothetical protein
VTGPNPLACTISVTGPNPLCTRCGGYCPLLALVPCKSTSYAARASSVASRIK